MFSSHNSGYVCHTHLYDWYTIIVVVPWKFSPQNAHILVDLWKFSPSKVSHYTVWFSVARKFSPGENFGRAILPSALIGIKFYPIFFLLIALKMWWSLPRWQEFTYIPLNIPAICQGSLNLVIYLKTGQARLIVCTYCMGRTLHIKKSQW